MADMGARYRVFLLEELRRRKGKNARYSLRGYARALGVDVGFLSKLLSGKALLSLDLADRVAKKLKITGELRAEFLMSAAEEQRCHALYLIDPSLTECDPSLHEVNVEPKSRKKK